jgi:hypothetical protein
MPRATADKNLGMLYNSSSGHGFRSLRAWGHGAQQVWRLSQILSSSVLGTKKM